MGPDQHTSFVTIANILQVRQGERAPVLGYSCSRAGAYVAGRGRAGAQQQSGCSSMEGRGDATSTCS